MKDNFIHLSDAEMDGLLTTAEVSGLEIEDVISTAAWTFARNEDNFKSSYIREILFNNGGKGIEKPRPRKTVKENLYGLAHRVLSLVGKDAPAKETSKRLFSTPED
jgi:hypothetical protein